jgi:hypothetical protein
VSLRSEPLEVQVRGERLFISSYVLDNTQDGLVVDSGVNSVDVSDKANVFLIDGKDQTIE